MSIYKRVIIVILLSFLFCGCVQLQSTLIDKKLLKKDFKYKKFSKEDRYIMFALEYNRIGKKEEARELFLKLYQESLKEEYLFEYIKSSFEIKKYDDVISIIEQNRKQISRYETKILKLYILTLSKKRDYKKAQSIAKELLEKEAIESNYELLGIILLQKEEYKEAKKLFWRVYKNSSSITSLLNLTNIMYVHLDEKIEAINLLEAYTKLNGCNNLVCSKLLGFYQEQKNIDGVIDVLKKTYNNLKSSSNDFALNKVYKLLMYYLEGKDINEAISFLETSKYDDDKLLNLYRNSFQYDKAYELAKKLYDKKGNIDYLAQIAIIEFERAEDKRKVLDDVIKKFEDVLVVLDNHVYQNYLGYILIDFDIDIKKGLLFINKALAQAPNNLAYLDSLAWGQYKLKQCKEAYKNMKKVVDSTGLNDKEIRTHWEKIKECNK